MKRKTTIKENKKNMLKRIMLCLLLPTIAVGISLFRFSFYAKIDSDHTEVIQFAQMLKNNHYSIEESEKILDDVYGKKYSIEHNCNNEIVIGIYQANGETYTIKKIPFN